MKFLTKKGYVVVSSPEHHRADKRGYVMEHILVFEEKTGMVVPDNCCIHHLNGNKSDNRIENLCLMLTSAHTAYHNSIREISNETREKLSAKAKERFKDKTRHPMYKNIDIGAIIADIQNGKTVVQACKEHHISRAAFYAHIKEVKK